MITENERFIEIQGILAMSDIHSADCMKINDLIMELSKENRHLKYRINKAIEYVEKCNPDVDLHGMFLNESYISNYGACELLEILKGVKNG